MSISKDEIFYANAIIRNGLYLLEVNDKHVLNVNNKRLKISHENESLLWHYRLGHISNKRIKKLQDNNLLDLNSYEQIETCEPCLIETFQDERYNGKRFIEIDTFRCMWSNKT